MDHRPHLTRPGAQFRRLARRFGRSNETKAAGAVARTPLGIAWTVMATGGTYADQPKTPTNAPRNTTASTAARYQQALTRLGYQVALTPPANASRATPGSLTATDPHPAGRGGFADAAALGRGPHVSSQAGGGLGDVNVLFASFMSRNPLAVVMSA
jgi:hypothetical protein